MSQSVDLYQGTCRDLRCTLRVAAASHGRAHLLQHDRRSDLREPAMSTTNVTKNPLTYLAAFALLAGPLAAKERAVESTKEERVSKGSEADVRIHVSNRPSTPLFQGKQKAEIYFDPDTHVVTVNLR